MGAEVAVRGDVARAKARLERGLIRAPPTLRRADDEWTAWTGRFATGRSEGRDLGDQIAAEANVAAEFVWNADPRPVLDRGLRGTEGDPAIGQSHSSSHALHRYVSRAMPDGPVLEETETDPQGGTIETGRPVFDPTTQGASTVNPACMPSW